MARVSLVVLTRTVAAFAVPSVAFAAWFAVTPIVACNSSTDAAATTEGGAYCGATLGAMAGQGCIVEGTTCPVDYPCGPVLQQATCTCRGGKFACADGQGTLSPGVDPRCTPGADAAAACPATFLSAAGAVCTTPWQSCRYAAAGCLLAPAPRTNGCLCLPADAGAFSFVCDPDPCNLDASAPGDAAPDVDDAALDGGDASADAAPG